MVIKMTLIKIMKTNEGEADLEIDHLEIIHLDIRLDQEVDLEKHVEAPLEKDQIINLDNFLLNFFLYILILYYVSNLFALIYIFK